MNNDDDEHSSSRNHRQEKTKKFIWHKRKIGAVDRLDFLAKICQSDGTLSGVSSVLITWYNNDWGYACPTIQDLMDKTGLSRPTVYRILALLKEKEWFEIHLPREKGRVYARPCLKRTLWGKQAEKFLDDVVVTLKSQREIDE